MMKGQSSRAEILTSILEAASEDDGVPFKDNAFFFSFSQEC